MKKTLKLSKATLERIVQEFKQKAKTLNFSFFKIGRHLHVKLRYTSKPKDSKKSFSKSQIKVIHNTPHNSEARIYIKAKDEESLNRNTAKATLQVNKSILRKSFWFARHRLKSLFYDNCKVKLSLPMLVKFAHWAFTQGFEENQIFFSFSKALTQRHQDATDWAFNKGIPGYLFEMSSTVSLAKTYLLDTPSPPSFKIRWYHLKTKIFPNKYKKEQIEPTSNKSECKKVNLQINGQLSLDALDQFLSQIKLEPNPEEVEYEPSTEEQIVKTFKESGYRDELITIFSRYLNNELRKDLKESFQDLIDKMLNLLSDNQISLENLSKPIRFLV
ncbi:MAG: hypothetical protein C5B43_03645 [Verrucomicrobia bacterium]|nr:MAG: hypothetical protein C5B43_03645 [Verrucomicrobiota bacterium]